MPNINHITIISMNNHCFACQSRLAGLWVFKWIVVCLSSKFIKRYHIIWQDAVIFLFKEINIIGTYNFLKN